MFLELWELTQGCQQSEEQCIEEKLQDLSKNDRDYSILAGPVSILFFVVPCNLENQQPRNHSSWENQQSGCQHRGVMWGLCSSTSPIARALLVFVSWVPGKPFVRHCRSLT